MLKSFLANAAADHSLNIRLEPISLVDAAARVIKQYESVAQAKEIAIRTAFPAEPVMVQADPIALDQVLDNLISNAVKFSPVGKEVMVRVAAGNDPRGMPCLRPGRGIYGGGQETNVSPLCAALGAADTGEPSTGLGLSIAKKLVQAMNGDLIYEGSPGTGATFIVRITAAANPENK